MTSEHYTARGQSRRSHAFSRRFVVGSAVAALVVGGLVGVASLRAAPPRLLDKLEPSRPARVAQRNALRGDFYPALEELLLAQPGNQLPADATEVIPTPPPQLPQGQVEELSPDVNELMVPPAGLEDDKMLAQLEAGLRPITQLTANITPEAGEEPVNYGGRFFRSKGEVEFVSLGETGSLRNPYAWQLSPFCHRPLYFEEVRLERYGESHGIFQPAISAAHFFATIPLLPYKTWRRPPGICIYPEMEYWPGYYTLDETHWPPVEMDAVAVQLGVITGMVFLIP